MTRRQALLEHYRAVLDACAEALAQCDTAQVPWEMDTPERVQQCQARKAAMLAAARDAGLIPGGGDDGIHQ